MQPIVPQRDAAPHRTNRSNLSSATPGISSPPAPPTLARRFSRALTRGGGRVKAVCGPRQPATRRCPRVPGAGALADALDVLCPERVSSTGRLMRAGAASRAVPGHILGARGPAVFLSPRGTRDRLCKPAVGTNETRIREGCCSATLTEIRSRLCSANTWPWAD